MTPSPARRVQTRLVARPFWEGGPTVGLGKRLGLHGEEAGGATGGFLLGALGREAGASGL